LKRDKKSPKSAIWLLADSPPLMLIDKRYEQYEPLDWRFPTRHNIWTPIETIMNRELFRSLKNRIDDSKFYIRNAVESPEDWKHKDRLAADVADFQRLVEAYQPFLILTFGQRAFEFARRSQGEKAKPFLYWTVAMLSEEFDARLSLIREGKGILLPLLHAIIARQFETCHTTFHGDQTSYYEHIGCTLALILQGQFGNGRLSDLWM